MARFDLTDFEWDVIQPLLQTKVRGVKRGVDRKVLDGIFWRLRTGASFAPTAPPKPVVSLTGFQLPKLYPEAGKSLKLIADMGFQRHLHCRNLDIHRAAGLFFHFHRHPRGPSHPYITLLPRQAEHEHLRPRPVDQCALLFWIASWRSCA